MSNNKLFEESENKIYIPGTEISEEEKELINNIINYNKNENSNHDIFRIFPYQIIFKTIKPHPLYTVKFTTVIKNKKHYFKFEDDDKLYINNSSSYITNKKDLFLYFERLLYFLNNKIDDEIIDYLNAKFFNNINKCKYYDCLRWFMCLFYYWFKIIRKDEQYLYKINYKEFRQFILKNKEAPIIKVQQILKEFLNIEYTYKFYEDLKIMLNFIIPNIIIMGLELC